MALNRHNYICNESMETVKLWPGHRLLFPMSYESIDSVVKAWTQRHGLSLLDGVQEVSGNATKATYVSSNKGERFQIWVTAPDHTHVTVHAANFETNLGKEFCAEWQVPSHVLGNALEVVLSQVRQFMAH